MAKKQMIKRILESVLAFAMLLCCTSGALLTPQALLAETDAAVLPSYYDLRDYGLVTSVKDQFFSGTCWAHAAMSAAESNMLKTGMAEKDIDLSESHLVWFTRCQEVLDPDDPYYHEDVSTICNKTTSTQYLGDKDGYIVGANCAYVQGMLARGSGVQLQANAPDVTGMPTAAAYPDQLGEEQRYASYGLLANSNRFNSDQQDAIKRQIMQTGAMCVSVYYSSFLVAENGAYLTEESTSNHVLTIVGWDDHYSRENFAVSPEADGAWICKNSHGTEIGDEGYLYISYEEPSLEKFYSLEMIPSETYEHIYQFDGVVSSYFTIDSSTPITGAYVFTAERTEILSAVSFYTYNTDVPYTISIYENPEEDHPMSGTLLTTQDGTMPYWGYHVTDLLTPVKVTAGSRFSVVVTFHKNGARMAYDKHGNAENSSYVAEGVGTPSSVWYDTVENAEQKTGYGGDVCIKAFTKDIASIEESYVTGDVNADGAFTVADIVSLQKWLLAVPDVTLANWKAGDFCEDEQLDVFDLCLMKRELLKR